MRWNMLSHVLRLSILFTSQRKCYPETLNRKLFQRVSSTSGFVSDSPQTIFLCALSVSLLSTLCHTASSEVHKGISWLQGLHFLILVSKLSIYCNSSNKPSVLVCVHLEDDFGTICADSGSKYNTCILYHGENDRSELIKAKISFGSTTNHNPLLLFEPDKSFSP